MVDDFKTSNFVYFGLSFDFRVLFGVSDQCLEPFVGVILH